MDDLIAIGLGILVFLGPVLFRFLGSLFENKDSATTAKATASRERRNEFAEQLRQHRERQRKHLEPVEAEVVEDVVPVRSLSSSTQSGFDPYQLESPHLVDTIQNRDDEMDKHLHQVFDHSLGGISTSTASQVEEDVLHTESGVSTAKPTSLAADIAAMMKSKQDVRRAFILGEILQRPASTQPR